MGGDVWCVVVAVAVAMCDGGRREITMTSTNIVLVMAVKSSIVFWVSGSLVVYRLLDAPSSPSLQIATPTGSSSLMGPYFTVSGLNSIRNEVNQPDFGFGFGFVLCVYVTADGERFR